MAETGGKFVLHLPIDASDNGDLKAGEAVKVLVRDGDKVSSQVVKLDGKGMGMASFPLAQKPSLAQVVVGPHNASDEELEGLQTIRLELPRRLWGTALELKHPVVRIPSYYWRWWLYWCREFVVHGKLVCADGSPVPGAKVCAFDVDMWWWWFSTQQVGCATTDANGAFEIRFRWCCGWWPWWWWARRHWRVEPSLAQIILPALQTKPGLPRIPLPDPAPDLAIFDTLLHAQDMRRAGNAPRAVATAARAMTSMKPMAQAFDPAALARLQPALRESLPSIPELEALHLWPWFPWNPWTDCNPDLIFRATQACGDVQQVVVNETIWNTRWNVPTSINVTLTANENACCVPPHHGCEDGDCVVLTQACWDLVDNIAGNIGAPAAPLGYENPGVASSTGDRPYGGAVTLWGTAECMSGVDYYAFEWSTDHTNWNTMPDPAAGGFTRSYLDLGPLSFTNVPFNPSLIDGHMVFETLSHYEANHPPANWGSTRLWMYNRDVLMQWLTENNFSDGTYYLQLKGWNETSPGVLSNERVLDNCGDDHGKNRIVLTIDNRFVGASGVDIHGDPVDSHGNRCGTGSVHTCTVEPDTGIKAVRIIHDDGTDTAVEACGNFHIKDTDWLEVDFWAYDPNGHLAYFTLHATYGVNLDNDLLNIGGTLQSCPVPMPVPASGPQVGSDYGLALGQGAISPIWRGGAMRLRVKAKAAFPITCCYQLELRAHKRTIVNCDYSLWGHTNLSETSFMIAV